MKKETADRLLAKVRDDYDDIADAFSATRTDLWPEMERFRSFVKSGDRVLDIGCGNGRAYQLFAGQAIEYEGLDVSARLVTLARERVRDMLATFRVGSVLALPYETEEFDVAICVAVLHHVPSREYRLQALKEAFRVLNQGGILLMTNWDRWKPRYWKEHLAALAAKASGRSPYDLKDIFIRWDRGGKRVDRYYHAFTRRELADLCRQAGFIVEENYYVAKGKRVPWWRGDNLVTVCKKPHAAARIDMANDRGL
ncbi:MAG TPA: class I SAM-dependent methyltransferase [Candidatus Binatia bacterium]|jgi:ubiquinone/menaquinone biosynthesis C-methylase UbiE|nr:class I SAM-dependent methyltransferase [Candidatus Binatia bacterium]